MSENDSNNDIKERILLPPGPIINTKIYQFLIILMTKIFLTNKDKEKTLDKLKEWINKINENIIKNKNKYISINYDINNFKNIFEFIKNQNNIFAGDILEGVLILIFSYAFQADKTNTIIEYIYNTEEKIKLEEPNNNDFVNWFKKDMLKPTELKNIKELLNKQNNSNNNLTQKCPLYYLLSQIQKLKLRNIKKINQNKKIYKFIYRNSSISQKELDTYISNNFNQKKLIRFFFISVFIYYQNKNSPLMKYIKEKDPKKEKNIKNENKDVYKDNGDEEEIFLAGIPFDYNLNEAKLNNKYANTIQSPTKIEPRIYQMTLTNNKIEEQGLSELAKVLVFNNNIKKCFLDRSLINSIGLYYFNLGFGINDNYNLEELNISYNELNRDSVKYLSIIISHLKGLKTINLSKNDLKGNVAPFFIMLKRLYREGKIKLENLVLNGCNLNSSSFYELNELIKSKFCKLKRLYLDSNTFPSQINFLKKLKKNKILTEIYFNNCTIFHYYNYRFIFTQKNRF